MGDFEPIARRLRSKTSLIFTLESIQKNPLQNPLIIDNVFSFLNLRSIKQCRLVCKKWNDISIRYMEAMSVVRLKSPIKVAEFDQLFRKCVDNSLDISRIALRSFHLKFIRGYNVDNFSQTLLQFLEHQEPNIQKLTIDGVKLNLYLPITSNMGNNLSHLDIHFSKVAVSTSLLTSVKHISFRHCRIDVSSNCRISPNYLLMSDVEVFKDAAMLNNFLVNDILSLDNLKQLELSNFSFPRGSVAKLSIGLSGNITVDTLILHNVIVEDFSTSNWKISGMFKLSNVPYEIHNQMEFTELDFGDSTINLNALPNSIVKLLLYLNEDTKIVGSPVRTLPMLKYLLLIEDPCDDYVNIDGQRRLITSLENFVHCRNLVTFIDLMETHEQFPIQMLNTNWIPQNAQTLVLGEKVKIIGHPIRLNKVVFENEHMDTLLHNLKKLRSNFLILLPKL